MGKSIDFTKPLSEENKQWLRDRSRGWEVDEHERRLEASKGKKDDKAVAPVVEQPVPPYTVAAEPFEEPGPNPRQVPFPVGVDGEHVNRSTAEEVEEVDIEDLSVEELKAELHELGLPVSGNKDELVKRLKKADK